MIKTILCTLAILLLAHVPAQAKVAKEQIYKQHPLKAVDSVLKVKVGDEAPNFTLPAISGTKVSLSDYRGKKNVVISFVPAAFTPICSDQWPGYNIARELFEMHDAVILGITADNIPSLHAWTTQMGEGGLWFPVLSDFYPHGEAAKKYGILRPEGITERAIFIIDKKGILRYIDVHDINKRPDLGQIIKALEKLN
ncbi:peroxiredoxin [Maridesulfovibrio salexigens]|uniref:Alkyl hydroperoxide reductase/ Thiol specific antioxidant/ Mal allergen n=1 Tax=Maridesulfovibrio salexigens (strain ATCC 14822 / DSM 2638 / NCIMB 8403 / VKM B-1763) TaxID=526222 RepID=C6BWA8_MARSD|nr:peroxiredoxin [Maridesulfovibrio salexigens]ACS78352.1 alkyl hydroperoxide reductase/ Thiol specific antioxidant/ Mal allergen [Maridesulfovibrio salexigens DSM 2638]